MGLIRVWMKSTIYKCRLEEMRLVLTSVTSAPVCHQHDFYTKPLFKIKQLVQYKWKWGAAHGDAVHENTHCENTIAFTLSIPPFPFLSVVHSYSSLIFLLISTPLSPPLFSLVHLFPSSFSLIHPSLFHSLNLTCSFFLLSSITVYPLSVRLGCCDSHEKLINKTFTHAL